MRRRRDALRSEDAAEWLTLRDAGTRNRDRDNGRQFGESWSEYWLFLRELARAPFRTAAIAPSSPALASLMVSEIDVSAGYVVELGSGTGRFTAALLERGVPEDRLIVVEANPRFAELLRERFPRALLRTGRAEDLRRTRFRARTRFPRW